MMRSSFHAIALTIATCLATSANALTLDVTGPASVAVGTNFSIEILVHGSPELGSFSPGSVREFDFDLREIP